MSIFLTKKTTPQPSKEEVPMTILKYAVSLTKNRMFKNIFIVGKQFWKLKSS